MPPLPSGLPTIGPASITLLEQQGVGAAIDVLHRGKEGYAGLPGMGPAKWAVLWQWACSSTPLSDVLPEIENWLGDLEGIDGRIADSIDSSGDAVSEDLRWQRKRHEDDVDDLARKYQWLRDYCKQNFAGDSAYADYSRQVEEARSRIVQNLDRLRDRTYELYNSERQRQLQAEADAKERESMMKGLGCLLKLLIPSAGLYWLLN